jgi:hypothetical protein
MSTNRLNWLWATLGSAALLGAPACVGDPPSHGGGGGADAGAEDPDPDPDPTPLTLSGAVLDYAEAVSNSIGDPLQGATLATEGVDPPLLATAGPEGAFVLGELPPGSVFYVDAAPGVLPGYRPTRNAMLTIQEDPITHDLYLVSQAHAQQHYASVGPELVIEELGTAVVIVEMRRNNGEPFVGVPLEDVTLTDALGQPVPGVAGPYFIGGGNVMDPAILTSTLAFGTVRVGFLNVPPGDHKFNLDYLTNQGEPRTLVADVMTIASGATLSAVGGQGEPGDGGGGGGEGQSLSFTGDIYPDLQRASQGGLACATCHTAGGSMPLLQFDLPAADVHAAILARPGVIDLLDPAASLFLTKPLYETPPNHPNATFANELDPYYMKWMLWIEQGAPLESVPLPIEGGGNGGGGGGNGGGGN